MRALSVQRTPPRHIVRHVLNHHVGVENEDKYALRGIMEG
jgi:hypothetical protein